MRVRQRMFWTGMAIGCFVGMGAMFLTLALCHAAGTSDRQADELERMRERGW